MLLKKTAVAFMALFMLSACNTTKRPENVGEMTNSEESSLMSEFQRNVGDRIFFALNRSDLSHDSKALLNKQAAWLNKNSHVKATIEGHCDERGTREYNLALGERRAEAVRKFLVGQGIEASRLETISYGKEKPAVVGDNEAAWAQNRRAVTIIMK